MNGFIILDFYTREISFSLIVDCRNQLWIFHEEKLIKFFSMSFGCEESVASYFSVVTGKQMDSSMVL